MTGDSSRGPRPPHVPILYVRVGDSAQLAGEVDQAVARSYPSLPDKGQPSHGRRLTILTAQSRRRPGEEIRVIHVAEATDPEAILYTMGPKAVLGEYVDGQLATSPSADTHDALRPPGLYDGPVVPGPVVDYGYDVSAYRFEAPGLHRIVWRLGDLVSNELVISIE